MTRQEIKSIASAIRRQTRDDVDEILVAGYERSGDLLADVPRQLALQNRMVERCAAGLREIEAAQAQKTLAYRNLSHDLEQLTIKRNRLQRELDAIREEAALPGPHEDSLEVRLVLAINRI
ncbi:MAG: hypothetical protein AAFV53_19865 [Myxococcota bacterium]